MALDIRTSKLLNLLKQMQWKHRKTFSVSLTKLSQALDFSREDVLAGLDTLHASKHIHKQWAIENNVETWFVHVVAAPKAKKTPVAAAGPKVAIAPAGPQAKPEAPTQLRAEAPSWQRPSKDLVFRVFFAMRDLETSPGAWVDMAQLEKKLNMTTARLRDCIEDLHRRKAVQWDRPTQRAKRTWFPK